MYPYKDDNNMVAYTIPSFDEFKIIINKSKQNKKQQLDNVMTSNIHIYLNVIDL